MSFFEGIDECLESEEPDVIIISGVLQYLAEPHEIFSKLLKISASLVIIDRTPFLNTIRSDQPYIQVTPASIYSALYPIWFFNEDVFLNMAVSHGYTSTVEFDAIDQLDNSATCKGMIFER